MTQNMQKLKTFALNDRPQYINIIFQQTARIAFLISSIIGFVKDLTKKLLKLPMTS
jgi:hypothetical protein